MANYFYVKNGLGTRTTDTSFTAAETGAFGSGNLTAANCYASLGVVAGLTTPPGDGDFVFVSSAHSITYNNGTSVILNEPGAIDGAGLVILSVDDTDVTAYLPGASEYLNDGADDFQIRYSGIISGVDLATNDDVITYFNASNWVIRDCTLTVNANNDVCVILSADGTCLRLENVDIAATNTLTDTFSVGNGSHLEWIGGSLTGNTPSEFIRLTSGGNGGGTIDLVGVDLSAATGTLIAAGVAGTQDTWNVNFRHCLLADAAVPYGTIPTNQQRYTLFNTDTVSGANFHRFEVATGAGKVFNNDAVYVTAGPGWFETTDHSSMQIITTAFCSPAHPLIFELPQQYVDLSSASTDTLTFELVSDFALTGADLHAKLIYPDGTTSLQANVVGSRSLTGSNSINPLDTAALTAGDLGAADWTGEPASPNFYKLVLDTSGDAGQAMGTSVEITFAKPSVDGTAGGLVYIHPVAIIS